MQNTDYAVAIADLIEEKGLSHLPIADVAFGLQEHFAYKDKMAGVKICIKKFANGCRPSFL